MHVAPACIESKSLSASLLHVASHSSKIFLFCMLLWVRFTRIRKGSAEGEPLSSAADPPSCTPDLLHCNIESRLHLSHVKVAYPYPVLCCSYTAPAILYHKILHQVWMKGVLKLRPFTIQLHTVISSSVSTHSTSNLQAYGREDNVPHYKEENYTILVGP